MHTRLVKLGFKVLKVFMHTRLVKLGFKVLKVFSWAITGQRCNKMSTPTNKLATDF
jgi:hypothetical protein